MKHQRNYWERKKKQLENEMKLIDEKVCDKLHAHFPFYSESLRVKWEKSKKNKHEKNHEKWNTTTTYHKIEMNKYENE